MHPPKNIFKQSRNNNFEIISEIITEKKAFVTSAERHSIFEYVQDMARGLAEMSTKADNCYLSYLLALAEREARLAKGTAGEQVSSY